MIIQIGIYKIVANASEFTQFRDLEWVELQNPITLMLVAPRMAISTIFIISLAKWFDRQQLHYIFVRESSIIVYRASGL